MVSLQIGQKTRVSANHVVSILRTLYNKMDEWGIYPRPNPTAGVIRYRLPSGTRFVQEDEMPRVLLALQDETVRIFFFLILLVGCRPGEARSASA